MLYLEDMLNREPSGGEVTIPVDAIAAFVKIAVIAGIVIYNFGIAKGRKLAAIA
jgi:hypothetical protein